jgi:hypothetical protein
VTWRRVHSDFKPNAAVLLGARTTTEPVPKEVAKTIDVQSKEKGLSQDNDFPSDMEAGSDDESGGGFVTWSSDDVYRRGGCRTTNFDEATLGHLDSNTPAGSGDAQRVAVIESNNFEEEKHINNKQVLGKSTKGVAQALSSVIPIEPLLATSPELPVKAPNGPSPDSTGGRKRLRAVAELEDQASQPPHVAVTRSQLAAKVARRGRAGTPPSKKKTCSSTFTSMAC